MTTLSDSQPTKSLLNKDPKKVGKLFIRSKQPRDNPEEQTVPEVPTKDPLKEIGIGTQRINLFHTPEVEIIKPLPQFKLHSSVFDISLRHSVRQQDDKSEEKIQQKKLSRKKLNRSPIGSIHRQHRSAPKQTNLSYRGTTPQLPSIKKIDKNLEGFRSFVDTSKSFQVSKELPQQIHNRFANSPRIPTASKVRNSMDTEENEKLQKPENRVFNPQNNRKIKLPTFKDEQKQDSEQAIQKNERKKQESLPMTQSNLSNTSANGFNQFASSSNGFIYSNHKASEDNSLPIDIRTPISTIKQALVESGQQIHVSFDIPDIFFIPPSSFSTSQELHMLMLEVFSHVGISPQIVSIKKYVNCVILREKKLCILWNFNGKIYFGGWQRGDHLSQGNKNGIGLEWVPSRYIYYGEFKDNKKEGYGVMKKANKEVYIGCWKNNQRWGWGKIYDSEGFLHQNGQFVEGCFVADHEQQ